MLCQRDKFSLTPDSIYLNGAYMSPLLKAAEQKGIEGLRLKQIPSDLNLSHFFEATDQARTLFANLIDAKNPASCVIIPSVSYAIANAAKNIKIEEGQNIILVDEGFPSNYYYWKRLAADTGAEVRIVRKPDSSYQSWDAHIIEKIDSNTRVVSMSQVHWADGYIFNLKAISDAIHKVEGYLVIDGTQSIGAFPFDIEELQPDVLAVASYKWMLGSLSIGMAYYNERFDDGIPIEESWYNRKDSNDFKNLANYQDEYRPGARRYEVGEAPNFALLPVMCEGMRQLTEWTPQAVQAYCKNLVVDHWDSLVDVGYRIDATHCASHLFGIRLPKQIEMAQVQAQLIDENISVSYRGDAIRVSPNVYNAEEEMEVFTEALISVVNG